MSKIFNNRALAVSQKVYGWLLRAYPKAHREEYGPAMAQLFRDQGRDEWNESQGCGVVKLWLRVLPDLVDTSIRERIATLNKRKTMNDKLTNLTHDRTTPTAIFVRVFVVVFLIALLIATAITFILPESYASTARIKVEQGATWNPHFLQTTFEIMQSQVVLSPVIDKLNLNVEWGKKYFAGQTLKSAETLKILKGRMSLAVVCGTKLIAITVYSDDKKEAAQIANTVAESYRDYRIKSHEELVAKEIEALPPGQEKQAAQLEAQKPKPVLVQITDMAEPGHAPVRPNKTLNIFIGAMAGGFLGLVAGAASALISFKFGNRGRKNLAPV